MDALPLGITGFWSAGGSPPPATNEKDFISSCHAVSRRLGGQIESLGEALSTSPSNYCAVKLRIGDQAFLIAVNAHHPFLALAEPGSELAKLEFVDCPRVTDEFRRFACYTVLAKEALDTPVSNEAIAALAPAERKEIKYWNPRSIGEIVFNQWD